MSLRVMRPADGKMMKLVKYTLMNAEGATEDEATTVSLDHNHILTVENMGDLPSTTDSGL